MTQEGLGAPGTVKAAPGLCRCFKSSSMPNQPLPAHHTHGRTAKPNIGTMGRLTRWVDRPSTYMAAQRWWWWLGASRRAGPAPGGGGGGRVARRAHHNWQRIGGKAWSMGTSNSKTNRNCWRSCQISRCWLTCHSTHSLNPEGRETLPQPPFAPRLLCFALHSIGCFCAQGLSHCSGAHPRMHVVELLFWCHCPRLSALSGPHAFLGRHSRNARGAARTLL